MKKLILLLLYPVLCAAQSVAPNPSSVIQANPHQLGLNVGSPNYYDNGQIYKNLIGWSNAQPVLYQTYWVVNNSVANDTSATVSTSGTAVTATSGSWSTSITGNVLINSVPFPIASVTDSTHLTLGTSAGTQTGATLVAGTGLTNKVNMENQYDTTPAGTFVGATILVTESQASESPWNFSNTAKGCSSTVTAQTAANSGSNLGITLTFSPACSHPITSGDQWVITQYRNPTPAGDFLQPVGLGLWDASGGGGSITGSSNVCSSCGVQSISMNGATGTAGFNNYFDSTTLNTFVEVTGTYNLGAQYECASGQTPTFSVAAGRVGGATWYSGTPSLTCDGSWHSFSATATGTDNLSTPRQSGYVSWRVTGGTMLLAQWYFQQASDTNPTIFRQAYVDALKNQMWFSGASGPTGTLRAWWEQNAEDLDSYITPTAYKLNASLGYYGSPVNPSLTDFLTLAAYLGVDPYIEWPITASTTDSANLMNYLAGTTGTYAARRIAYGQTTPWTSVFNTIHIAYCNECWNSDFVGQNIPFRGSEPINYGSAYTYDYSLRARDIFAAMRGAPEYAGVASKIDLVFNNLTGNTYNLNLDLTRAKPDSVEGNGYWYQQVSNTATMWTTAMAVPSAYILNPSDPSNFNKGYTYVQSLNVCGSSGTATCKFNVYEENVSTQFGTVNQTNLDYITAGAGQGIVLANLYLKGLQAGILTQNVFAGEGPTTTGPSGETSKIWSTNIDYGGQASLQNGGVFGGNYVPRPTALGAYLANSAVIGSMINCQASSFPTYNFAGDSLNGAQSYGTAALNGVNYLDAYCFASGSNVAIVFINSNLGTAYSVTLPSGISSAAQQQFAPSSTNLLNEGTTASGSLAAPATMAIASSTLTSPTSISLPALSITVLKYSTGTPQASPPTFNPGTGTYSGTQSVALATTTSGATICYTVDGSTPTATTAGTCTHGTTYTSHVSVASSLTMKALATETGYINSAVATATYTINTSTSTIIFTCSGPCNITGTIKVQ